MVTCINIKDAKAGDYYCGRSSSYKLCPQGVHDFSTLGNPFTDGTREENIAEYRELMEMYEAEGYSSAFLAHIDVLKEAHKNGDDVRLICFCKPKACHTDVIKEFVEKE